MEIGNVNSKLRSQILHSNVAHRNERFFFISLIFFINNKIFCSNSRLKYCIPKFWDGMKVFGKRNLRLAFSIKILKNQVTYCNDTLIITIGRPGELEGDPFMTRCYCSSPKVSGNFSTWSFDGSCRSWWCIRWRGGWWQLKKDDEISDKVFFHEKTS